MPKRSKHPGLRSHSWRTTRGEVKTAYYLDNRGGRVDPDDARRDIPLGTDYQAALQRWQAMVLLRPLTAGTIGEAIDRWEREDLPTYRASTRRDYGLALRWLRPVFGPAVWSRVTMPTLAAYLAQREGKRRANLELSVLSIIWRRAILWGMTTVPWPAAGLERSKWKNREKPREIEVTPGMFAAIYAEADQLLRDAMDIASATGLRLTDVVTVGLPADGVLRGKASKTGKRFAIDMAGSAVLAPLLERRRTYRVAHTMLLSTPTREATVRMLSDRWVLAREAAASRSQNAAMASAIKALILRDMRKLAADLAPSLDDAADLLQHGDSRLTARHYRLKVPARKAVR